MQYSTLLKESSDTSSKDYSQSPFSYKNIHVMLSCYHLYKISGARIFGDFFRSVAVTLNNFLISLFMMFSPIVFSTLVVLNSLSTHKIYIASTKFSRKSRLIKQSYHYNLNDILMMECPALYEKFHPLQWASHPIIQSTFFYSILHVIEEELSSGCGSYSKSEKNTQEHMNNTNVHIKRDIILVKGGGSLALDWISRENISNSNGSQPILLNFPGIGMCEPTIGFGAMVIGAMQEHCILRNLSARTASVVYPGFTGHTLDSHKLPGSAYVATDDVGEVLRYVRTLYPKDPLILVGCSMGSAILTNWLVRNPEEAGKLKIDLIMLYAYGHSTAEAVLAADNDIFGGASGTSVVRMWKKVIFEDPFNIEHVIRLENMFPGFSAKALRSSNTIREWDEACLPVYGFASMEDMFNVADPVKVFYCLNVSTPMVIINADDDWLCPSQRLNKSVPELYSSMHNVAIIETNGGGHLGWADCLDLSKDKHIKRRHPLQILHISKALYGLTSDVNVEEKKTGGHCKWITTATNQVLDAALAGKLRYCVR